MHFNSRNAVAYERSQGFIKNQNFRPIILVLLFVSAFGIRLYHINRPLLDFAPIRQYQNAHIIRGLYYETNNSIPESKKRIAKLNMERMGFMLEPRVIENATVLTYRILGAEHLWVPRIFSSVFWVVGGIFLYLTARSIFSYGISLFSTAFYLFIPYGILASRAVQPDPLMVMMMLVSIYVVMKYDGNPSRTNLILAAIMTAIAVLIKPYCIFIIYGTFFSVFIFRRGFWKALFDRDTTIYLCITLAPTLMYYAYGFLSNVGFFKEHAQGSFLPHLLVHPFFWKGWLVMIGEVVGYLALFIAFLGLLKADRGLPKALLTGLWVGYFLFGLSATYQIHTHSYYHIPFIPIAALSIGPTVNVIMGRQKLLLSSKLKKIFLSSFLVIIVLCIGLGIKKSSSSDMLSEYKGELKTVATFMGLTPEFSKFLINDFGKEVRIAREIGDHVDHSGNTIFLDTDFGRVIAYHGEFSGIPWPTNRSLYGRRLRGTRVPDIKKDFTPEYIAVLYQGEFIKYAPDFFIITAFGDLEDQKDLKDYLDRTFPLMVKEENYLIYDLRGAYKVDR